MLHFRQILTLILLAATLRLNAATALRITRVFKFDPPSLSMVENKCRITMRECRPDYNPGKPALPLFGISIETPLDYNVESVTITRSKTDEIKVPAIIEWAQPHFQPGENPASILPDQNIYSSNNKYPSDDQITFRTDRTDACNLLSLNFSPLQYNPVSETLFHSRQITLTVFLAPLPSTTTQSTVKPSNLQTFPLNSAERCDYLIISTSNLIAQASPPWDFNALATRREYSGLITRIVAVEWIYENYNGSDKPQQIRHFLQDAHSAWHLKYLLIAGTHTMIPARKLYIKISQFFNEYTAEIPSDPVYYGCMDGSFDGNKNGLYGEFNDGDSGGDVDLTAEILVGRFPVENALELAHMVRKTLRYDQAAASEFYNNGFVSEKVSFGNVVYGKPFMDEIRDGSTTYGRNTLGYLNSPYLDRFAVTNSLHDSENFLFATNDILKYLNSNLHSINHIGHGSTYQCMRLNMQLPTDQAKLASLENSFPYALYSQACLSGAFDHPDCFAETLVSVSNAASIAVMNSREGWAVNDTIAGASHFFHRHFWDSAFRGQAVTFGEMSEAARRANLPSVPSYGASVYRWVYYGLNLFGDPALPVMPPLLTVPPSITHQPLINTYNTLSNHNVKCILQPVGIYDPDSPFIAYSCQPGNLSITQKMSRINGNEYHLQIPAQPRYTRIDYSITASNRAGFVASDPPTNNHTFFITDQLTLNIAGSPTNIGTCEPAYGVHHSASGLIINASSQNIYYEAPDTRYRCLGLTGTGSVPPSSTNQYVSFRINRNSILVWKWQRQYLVRMICEPEITDEKLFWINSDTTFQPPPAKSFVSVNHTNILAFSGWLLNGYRSPVTTAKSLLLHPPIDLTTPICLTASYVDAQLDQDGNGIADWFELRFLGEIGNDIYTDHDNDGYDLYQEFQDHSDPLDILAFPAPPSINHNPTSSMINKPGPYAVNVTITDTHNEISAALHWRLNGSTWQITALNTLSNSIYHASVAESATAGDMLSYFISATDPSGNYSETSEFNLFFAYPIADFTLIDDISVITQSEIPGVTNSSYLINRGNTPLQWSLNFGLAEPFASPDLSALLNWQTESIEQPWNISTNRAFSPPYALHAQLLSAAGAPHYASITLPPLEIGTDAKLSFSYWIDAENYVRVDPTRAFDGGIVEYSIDDGTTFQLLPGPYTHTMYGWDMSPWPDQTPCFSALSTNWHPVVFDLTRSSPETAGFEGHKVIFRFVYGGDDNTDHEGWYIDDICIHPSLLPDGFNFTLPDAFSYSVPPGSYVEMLWRNLPGLLQNRNTATTVFINSNAPQNSSRQFNWKLRLREPPLINRFNVNQIPDGTGAVCITTQFHDIDHEPLILSLEWSDDRGHNWHPAALTNIVETPPLSALPTHSPDGTLTNLINHSNAPTNRIDSVWNTTLPPVSILWESNLCIRLTLANPWFTTNRTAIFSVDNTPPYFTPGCVQAAPYSTEYSYLISTGDISLAWPEAIETPAENPVIYHILSGDNLIALRTNLTSALLNLTNMLDSSHHITVFPSDPIGNHGKPLELALLILDANSDFDNDGISTADEEIAGTDAVNPKSRFIINALELAQSATLVLTWSSVTNRCYAVETTKTLTNPEWKTISTLDSITGNGELMSITLPQSDTNAFFRVRVKLNN
jgi:hypothetical protein